MGKYQDFYRRSIDEPDEFWAEQAKLIDWHKPFDQVLDYSRPPFARWFVGGLTNLCHNAVDRHLKDRAGAEGAGLHLHRNRSAARPTPTANCMPRSTVLPRCCARRAWRRATASSSTCR